MKILSIIGARPQFVKEAIIQKEINKYDDIEEIVVHTGQHYDENMSDIFFKVLNMRKPDYNLGINGSSHGQMTGEMLIKLEEIMIKESPDVVILYGDTNSTLAGALAASKLKIKVAHIEAGLRQEPKDMPEEINRVLTDRISSYLFVPSEYGMKNLTKEGLTNNVYFTGDVMYDIFLEMKPHFDSSLMDELNLEKDNFILLTMHRDFNVDNKETLKTILEQLEKINREIPIVWPLHPRTASRIKSFELEYLIKDMNILEPIDYLNLMGLTEYCKKIITDSGGFQKESYFAKKEGIVIMPDTSWRELTDKKINLLANPNEVYEKTTEENNQVFEENIYGNGDSAKQIIKILYNDFIN
ncbi:non-hydrolyzing UDP-N-acetylglucosamine 2-epimerase [Miniphocaeibacter massiliensis]|uniref:non-hydrolyzing UDP-N-acetylglucosamine 2-epimerase n=1 Tax=Miniphocaeibacter massiliensis TaxID=2041841 RepID=UPI000C1B82F8|nr:UDP-N-acetylglucosamine 2-epimerase (non-hydrolyzing) [Miniphocaeibacter massiliensis]